MTATVLLVRHAAHADLGGRLTGRAPGVPLSEAGRAQADALARALGRENVAAVHASPRERAQETARAVAAPLGLAVETVPALDEVDFGRWTGLSFAALRDDPEWRLWNEARGTARCPGGESMAEVQLRAVAHVREAAARHPGGTLLMVSHCDVIRAVLADALGAPLGALLRFDCDPASVGRLVVGGWGARVVSMNERAA